MKRDRAAIRLCILEICQEPANVTRIVYQANLNFHTVHLHLEKLLVAGMLEFSCPDGGKWLYTTTPKGIDAMKAARASGVI